MGFENVETQVNETMEMEQHLNVRTTNSAMKTAGLFFFLLMVLQLPISFLIVAIGSFVPVRYYVVTSLLVTQGYLLVCALIYIFITKKSFCEDLNIRKYKCSSFFLSLVMLICATPMANWLNLFSQLFAKNEISNSIYEITTSVPAWLGIIMIGCLPGFIEELLYRGIIFNAFKKRSVLTGIVVSSLTFGLMHMNLNQIMYAVYLGIIFALLVEATGSLVSTMILHMIFNAINTMYVYLLPKLYEFLGQYSSEYANVNIEELMNATPSKQSILMSVFVMLPFAIGGCILAVLLIRKIAEINGRSFSWNYICGNKEEVRRTKPANIFLILGCLFCIVIAVLAL